MTHEKAKERARHEQPEVLVAGAGPVGQVMALELAARGIGVEIVDEEWKTAGHSYALALHSESLRLFRELGLLESILAEAVAVRTLELYDGVERRAAIDLGAGADPPYLAVVSQANLERILEDALAERGVEVRWNHRLARFSEEGEVVRAVVDKLVKETLGYAVSETSWLVGRSKEHLVPFLVGADGHGSLVRRQMEIPFEEVAPAQHFSVFELSTDVEVGDAMRVGFDAEGMVVFWPLPGQRCRFGFESPDPPSSRSGRRKDRLMFQFRGFGYHALEEDHLRDLLEQRAPWFEGALDEIHWSTEVRFERRIAERFGEGRRWLVGDAGHMAGPAGVHSMNVGFREARALAIALHRILREGAPLDELERYERQRRAEWRRLQGLDGGLVATEGADPWVAEHADRLLACLPASGAGLDAIARTLHLEHATVSAATHA